jgi:hypothetical protein
MVKTENRMTLSTEVLHFLSKSENSLFLAMFLFNFQNYLFKLVAAMLKVCELIEACTHI